MKVIKSTERDIDRAVDLAFSMQSNKETRCRHLFIDATRKEIYDLFMSYIKRDEHELLLVEKDGRLEGVTPIYWIEEDFYVSYEQGPYGYDYESVSNCLLEYVVQNFKGYTFYINTANEHVKSINFYKSKDFEYAEKAVLLRLEDYKSEYENDCVQEVNSKNSKVIYEWIENHINEDTYWNSKRINENLDQFMILGYFDNEMKGHIIGRGKKDYTEVIAFSGDESVKEELFKSLITTAYKNGVKEIDLYTEDDYEESLGLKYGFKFYDSNNCFIKTL